MKNLLLLFVAVALVACGSDSASDSKTFHKEKFDDIIKSLDNEKDFSIILFDMDMPSADEYKHRYKIIRTVDSLPKDSLTAWHPVSESFFDYHSSNMGMEIASKTDGKLSKVAAPPGYNNYVGNKKYGEWRQSSSGTSFWAFYGQYAFMSSMLGLVSPVGYGGYNRYTNNYRGRTPYYGGTSSNGSTRYGTGSSHAKSLNPNFDRRMQQNSTFKNKVNSAVSRSSSKATGGKRSTTTSTSSSRKSSSSSARSSSKTSRSSSRYSGSSRSRSSSYGGK